MMVTFRDVGELKELNDYYLDSFKEAESIAEKARNIAVEKFKCTDSAILILDHLN
ncbi:MAG: hypothetical protein QXU18_12665 [Thermoplasmatales archaeon]